MASGEYFDAFAEVIRNIPREDLSTQVFTNNPAVLEDPSDVYSHCASYLGLYGARAFQYVVAHRLGGKILNAACANDPSGLHRLGAINMDFVPDQPWAGLDLKKTPNFQAGSVFDIPFPGATFDTVVLGEFIEHCTYESAAEAILECRRVLKPGGRLVLTFPLDGRPRDEQDTSGTAPENFDPEAKVTTYHRTWWSMKMQADLRKRTRMVEVARAALVYVLTCPLGGWGLVWQKLN
jgi:predicted SAM-dependent methyltransferase